MQPTFILDTFFEHQLWKIRMDLRKPLTVTPRPAQAPLEVPELPLRQAYIPEQPHFPSRTEYNRGCRCSECKAINAAHMRACRARRRARYEARHG